MYCLKHEAVKMIAGVSLMLSGICIDHIIGCISVIAGMYVLLSYFINKKTMN